MIRGILNFLIANFVVAMLICCRSKTNNNSLNNPALPLVGSWQLITAAVIQNGDTVVTAYNKNISFIKIINETHFSFQQHDLHKGKDSDVVFVAGGGKYTLQDSLYTEKLDYCSAREWEGNNFKFTIKIIKDTFIQSEVEKIVAAGIDRINIEKYIRIKK